MKVVQHLPIRWSMKPIPLLHSHFRDLMQQSIQQTVSESKQRRHVEEPDMQNKYNVWID